MCSISSTEPRVLLGLAAAHAVLVQDRAVPDIRHVLDDLEPVAVELLRYDDAPDAVLPYPEIEPRQYRRGLRTHIGPVQPRRLLYGVGRVLDRRDDGIVVLGRRLNDVTLAVVQPSVVGAGDAALFHAAVPQRSAAVGAVVSQEANTAALVLEQYEVLAQYPRRIGGPVLQYIPRGNSMPVAAEQLAHGGPRPYSRKEIVLLCG